MKLQLKNFLIAGMFTAVFASQLALADIPQDTGLLPPSEEGAEYKRYELAVKGSHYYSLWCANDDNDVNDYGIQYNYRDNKHSPVGAKFSGGSDLGLRIYYKKDILIDKASNAIIFKGIGKLNSKLTKLTLENGIVKPCKHDLEEETIMNGSDE